MRIAKQKQPSQQPRTQDREQWQRTSSQRTEPVADRPSQSCTCGGDCPRCRSAHNDLGSLRESMESLFSSEFSAVRVHRDGLADAHNARAVTIGEDIHLSSAEQDVTTSAGRELLGHELAHVLQQRGQQGAMAAQSALESEADRAGAAASAGRRFNVMQAAAPGSAQRKPKVAPAPPSGSILYVGMNNPDPEIKALQDRYKAGSPVGLTIIKGTSEAAATSIGTGTTFDLTTDAGVEALVKALTSDSVKQAALKTLFKSQDTSDRDDLAHVAKVYADTEADGKDRMTRVVLSGHSGGSGVLGHGSEVYFSALIDLGKVFPKAAAQTKHLIVAGCHTGDETTILDKYVPAYPNLLTVWAWWDACPTGRGAALAVDKWAELTEHGQTKLPKQDSGIATWSGGVYSGSSSARASAATVLASIRSDDARFKDYFDGIRADPSPHGGWLETYYTRVFSAARRADIRGGDHDEMERNRQRALLLRYWKVVVKKFWAKNGTTIKTGYGTASVPNYASLSRKDALKAIKEFSAVSTAGAAEKAAAQNLLTGLQVLDPKLVPDSMVAE